MTKKRFLLFISVAVFAVLAAIGFGGWYLEHNRVSVLEQRVAEMQKKEQRSAIDKSISEQLGVIAAQQKEIAEEKTEEAMQQKQRADEAFSRSELERQKAEEAEHEARQEKEKADLERKKAVIARSEAEKSEQIARNERNTADTLRFTALGRSLGAASRHEFSNNQVDLAQVLAYYSYYYTKKYKGEVYVPDIFQSMLSASHRIQNWHKHRGMIRGIDFMPKGDNRIVSICDNGMLLIHTKEGNHLRTEVLFDGKQTDIFKTNSCDLRYLYISNKGIISSISRSGHLLINEGGVKGKTRIIPVLEKDYPTISWMNNDGKSVIVIGEHNMALVDLTKSDESAVVETKKLTSRIVSFGKLHGKLILFDNKGKQYLVKSFNDIEVSDIPIPEGLVTVFHATNNMNVYGMDDGTIYLKKRDSNDYIALKGHKSFISHLRINGDRLYSSSYDGKVNFWYVNNEKIIPIEILSKSSWIMDFTISNDGQSLWVGDMNGYLTEELLDVEAINGIIENELKQKKRDFTQEEWNYYIGKTTPYEPLIIKNGKEVVR